MKLSHKNGLLYAVTTGYAHASQIMMMLFLHRFTINVSEGCSIEAKAYGGNGHSDVKYGYLKLNGVFVWQASWIGEYPNDRGVNTFVIDTLNCSVKESRTYDTYADSVAASRLRGYIEGLNEGTVLVGVSCDEASNHLDRAEAILSELGADVSDVGFRGAWAFLAVIGDPSRTIRDKELTEASAMERQPIITAYLPRT